MSKSSAEMLSGWIGQVEAIDRKLEVTPITSPMTPSKRSRVLEARRYLVRKINTEGYRTIFNMAIMSEDPHLVIRAIRAPRF